MAESAFEHDTKTAEKATPPKLTKEDIERRLLQATELLLDGFPRAQVVRMCQSTWQVSRRTAQVYVREAERRLRRDAIREDRLYYLRLSQLQRDRLLQLLMRASQQIVRGGVLDNKLAAQLPSLVNAACRLLDSRDRTAATIHQHLGREATVESERQENAELCRLANELARRDKELLDSLELPEPPAASRDDVRSNGNGDRKPGARERRQATERRAKPQAAKRRGRGIDLTGDEILAALSPGVLPPILGGAPKPVSAKKKDVAERLLAGAT